MRDVPNTTPNRLKQIREAKGLTRLEVAMQFGVYPSTVQRWEEIGPPRWEMPRLASYYEVTVGHMMGWEEAAA